MSKKILIIDDDKELSEEMMEILRQEGHQVQAAFDGAEGEEFIKKNRYDLVLLDLKMSEMTGVDLLKRVKKYKPACKFFIVSGRPFIEKMLKKEDLSDVVSGYVNKPFDINALLKKIDAL